MATRAISPDKAPGRWARKYPELGQGPLPVSPYIDPAFYEKEKTHIFKKQWLYVALERELPGVGSYKVRRLDAADTSVIVIRGKDNVIRAFHNACSHRGNTVITETGQETYGRNRAGVVTCRFHGWVYNALGELVNVPHEDRFYSCFNKAENGLAEVHCDTWAGFVFVNVDPGPVQSLKEFLGGYGEHFGGFDFAACDHGFTYHTTLNCNWKVASDAFAEAYHVDTIHAGSFPNVFKPEIEDVQLFGPHRTCSVRLQLDTPPASTPIGDLANARSRSSLAAQGGGSSLPPTLNPNQDPDWSFELSVLFPSVLLHVSEGIWFTHQFWPITHDKTLWEGKYYLKKPTSHSELWGFERAMVLQRNAWLEDTATMEDTYRAMLSGAKKVQHLQDEEILIRHNCVVVDEFVNA
jgi:phenylpropionate dioxygenase-like ring-hydroxylating dioxygenase large terminal subunit